MMIIYFILGAFLGLTLYVSDARELMVMLIGGLLAVLFAWISALKRRISGLEQPVLGLPNARDSRGFDTPLRVPPPIRPAPAPVQAASPATATSSDLSPESSGTAHFSMSPSGETLFPVSPSGETLFPVSPSGETLDPIAWIKPEPIAPPTIATPTRAQFAATDPTFSVPAARTASPILQAEPGWGVAQSPSIKAQASGQTPSQPDAPPSFPHPTFPTSNYTPTQMPPAPELPAWANKLLSFENWPIKLGMLLLLVGLASGYRYLAERGYFNVPIGWRLVAVALAAIAALVFGYGKREEKRSFSLSVQGAALGALLLTVYAALQLYQLINGATAFSMMLAIVATGVALAVMQDALWLALFAAIGGFAAPKLASTGGGSHIHLFGYYLVLNLGILAIALKKGWRSLNFLGAICTFGIGIGWGANYYQPEFFSTVEPFLLAFFAIYLTITVLYTLRHGAGEPVLDGVLVFGVPLASLGAQAGLLAGQDKKLALSSFCAALIYGGLSYSLKPHEQAGLLRKCFMILAVAFFTLAIPLYFSAQMTSALWALEGAAVLWLGLSQRRVAPVLLGLTLHVFAWFSYVNGYAVMTDMPALVNAKYLGALILALASFGCGWLIERAAKRWEEIGVQFSAFAWLGVGFGLLWWSFASISEIVRHVQPSFKAAALIAWLAASMLLCAIARGVLKFDTLRVGALVPLALLAPLAVFARLHGPILEERRGLALLAYLMASLLSMVLLAKPASDGSSAASGPTSEGLNVSTQKPRYSFPGFGLKLSHSLWLAGVCVLATLVLDSLLVHETTGEGVRFCLYAAPFALVFFLLIQNISAVAMPLQSWFDDVETSWREPLLQVWAVGIAIALLAGSILRGDSNPISFVPLLNPLEIGLLSLFGLLYWHSRDAFGSINESARYVILTFGFWLLTTFTLRGVLQVYDPSLASLGHAFFSRTGQAALALVWSLAGCGAMLLGHAKHRRPVWFAGAALMGVVLAKMLLVDRHNLGELPGIFATLGVGALLAAVGYFAPVPPSEVSHADGQ